MVVSATTSTALVPACDIQALDVLRQLRAPSDEEQAYKAIQTTLRGISLEGALNILKALGYAKDGFYYQHDYWLITDLADERYFPGNQGRAADDTLIITFWGGPPTKLAFYNGTFATYLADRVLIEIEDKGVLAVASWIGTDTEGVI